MPKTCQHVNEDQRFTWMEEDRVPGLDTAPDGPRQPMERQGGCWNAEQVGCQIVTQLGPDRLKLLAAGIWTWYRDGRRNDRHAITIQPHVSMSRQI